MGMEGNWFWIFMIACIIAGNLASMYHVRQQRIIKSRPADLRICSCGHGFGTHAGGQSCKEQVERKHYTGNGSRNGHEWVTCRCLMFDGVRPLNAEEIVRGWSPPEVKK